MPARRQHATAARTRLRRWPHTAWRQTGLAENVGRTASLRLLNSDDAVYSLLFQGLLAAAGPMNLNLVDRFRSAHTEVHAIVILRKIAGTGHALRSPPLPSGRHFDARADAVAIALRALELDGDPVPCVFRDVVNECAPGAEI